MRPAGEVRAAQKLVALVAGPRHTHGKRSTYVRGCRCDDCRAAHAAYERARKAVTAPGEAKVRGPSQRGATRKR